MHLAKSTTAGLKRTFTIISAVLFTFTIYAQDNSPYSRYGTGDAFPNQNVVNRAMGGMAIGYSDNQSINLVNPASVANLKSTIFDIAADISIRTLKSNTSNEKSSAKNLLISYMQLGFPIASAKMQKKNMSWGMSFGLRPVTLVNYRIISNQRLPGIDSLRTFYEGTGGLSQANISTGFKIKNFSVGITSGYTFGVKDYSTRLDFINDSVVYYKSNTASRTNYDGIFLTTGIQYDITTKKKGLLRLGAYTNLQQTVKAKTVSANTTIGYDASAGGGIVTIDTVNILPNVRGNVILPATYGFGFSFANKNILYGADLEMTNWDAYRFYGGTDSVTNSYTFRVGGQYYPAKDNTPTTKYWSYVKYRAGMYFGNENVKLNNETRLSYGITFGAGIPLTSLQRLSYYREVVVMNLGMELGVRGNKQSVSLRESITRFNIGISMNARWFVKPKYD